MGRRQAAQAGRDGKERTEQRCLPSVGRRLGRAALAGARLAGRGPAGLRDVERAGQAGPFRGQKRGGRRHPPRRERRRRQTASGSGRTLGCSSWSDSCSSSSSLRRRAAGRPVKRRGGGSSPAGRAGLRRPAIAAASHLGSAYDTGARWRPPPPRTIWPAVPVRDCGRPAASRSDRVVWAVE